jgi:hypothetical protein
MIEEMKDDFGALLSELRDAASCHNRGKNT